MNRTIPLSYPIIFAIYTLSLVPIPRAGEPATFNPISHLVYCSDRPSCIHEIGHRVDEEMGWISQTPNFKAAVRIYLVVELAKPNRGALPVFVLDSALSVPNSDSNTMMELYANILEWCDGQPEKLPKILRPFYDDGLVEKYVSDLSVSHYYWLR